MQRLFLLESTVSSTVAIRSVSGAVFLFSRQLEVDTARRLFVAPILVLSLLVAAMLHVRLTILEVQRLSHRDTVPA